MDEKRIEAAISRIEAAISVRLKANGSGSDPWPIYTALADDDLRALIAALRESQAERDRLGEIVTEADPEIMLFRIWELVGKPDSHIEIIGGKEYRAYDGLLSTLQARMEQLAAVTAERDKYAAALRKYADRGNWVDDTDSTVAPPLPYLPKVVFCCDDDEDGRSIYEINEDGGVFARHALENN